MTTGGTITITGTWNASHASTMVVSDYSPPPGSTITVDAYHVNSATSAGTAVTLASLAITKPDIVVMAANMGTFSITSPSSPGSGWTLRQQTSTGGQAGIVFQDQVNPASSPVSASLTLGQSGTWTTVGASLLATPPPFILSGPISVSVGTAASFTLTPTENVTDVVTISSNLSGTLSHTTLTFSASSSSQTFTFTPSITGLATITLSSSHSYVVGASPFPLGSYEPFTLTGPVNAVVNQAATFTLTPSAATNDVLSMNDEGGGRHVQSYEPDMVELGGGPDLYLYAIGVRHTEYPSDEPGWHDDLGFTVLASHRRNRDRRHGLEVGRSDIRRQRRDRSIQRELAAGRHHGGQQ